MAYDPYQTFTFSGGRVPYGQPGYVALPGERGYAAPAGGESPYTGPYKGEEPGTISAQPFLDYMGDVKELALDPRQEIRQREEQRLQEQTRAGLSARGLNLSGAGQGIEQQAMSDFGLDWQNQQLARAGQGAQQLQMLGSLGQNIAQTGFQSAMELGASQFEYAPDVSGYGGGGGGSSFGYTPASYTGGGYGGMAGLGMAQRGPSPWLQEQQRRGAERQSLSDISNRRYGGSLFN